MNTPSLERSARRRSLIERVATTLAGLVLGAVLVSYGSGAHTSHGAVASSTERAAPGEDSEALKRLSRRLSALEREQNRRAQAPLSAAAPSADAQQEPEAGDLDPTPPSFEEDLEAFSQRLAGHAESPVDSGFAGSAQRAYTGELSALASHVGFELGKVDCREKSCTAVTRWPSLSAAMQGYPALLHHPYQQNCAVETMLPDRDDAAQGYEATFLFTCAALEQDG